MGVLAPSCELISEATCVPSTCLPGGLVKAVLTFHPAQETREQTWGGAAGTASRGRLVPGCRASPPSPLAPQLDELG